jgi:hypothetical protein
MRDQYLMTVMANVVRMRAATKHIVSVMVGLLITGLTSKE